MASLEQDVEILENAIRTFVQAIKRPQRWTQITATTGINLDRPSAVILHKLVAHEPKHIGVQDLARELGIEPPSVTRKTQLLEELGYIKRLPNPKDKRAVSLKITAKGHKASQKLWAAQRQSITKILEPWPSADRHKLAKLLEKFGSDLNNAN